MISRASSGALRTLVPKEEKKGSPPHHPNNNKRTLLPNAKAVKPALKKDPGPRVRVQAQPPSTETLGLHDITYERNNRGIEMAYDGQVRYFKLTRPLQSSDFNPLLKEETVPQGQKLRAVLKRGLTYLRVPENGRFIQHY